MDEGPKLELMTQHQKSIMDLFADQPTQEEKEKLPTLAPIKPPRKLRFDPSQDKLDQDQKAEEISELVMAKVKAKMATVRKETQAEESKIKASIEAKFKEIISPSVKKMERDQQENFEKAKRLAHELNTLKDTLNGFKVESILTDPHDLQAFRSFKETGKAREMPDVSQELLSMQIQMETSRRFFNVLSADLLSRSIKGVQIPDVVKQVMENNTIDVQ